jgi:hypothetical protein
MQREAKNTIFVSGSRCSVKFSNVCSFSPDSSSGFGFYSPSSLQSSCQENDQRGAISNKNLVSISKARWKLVAHHLIPRLAGSLQEKNELLSTSSVCLNPTFVEGGLFTTHFKCCSKLLITVLYQIGPGPKNVLLHQPLI